MTRQEHLEWCKQRALAYLPGNPKEAIESMMSDLEKWEDPSVYSFAGPLGLAVLLDNPTAESARGCIEGFN